MWSYVLRHGPPRPGGGVHAGRFFMDRDRYQQVPSPLFDVVSVVHSQRMMLDEGRDWDLIGSFTDPAAVEPLFAYLDFPRAP
jgi:hypothetical protein